MAKSIKPAASKVNPLVESRVSQKGETYLCLFISDAKKTKYDEFVGSRMAANMLPAFEAHGRGIVPILKAFAKDETCPKDSPTLAGSYWEEKEIQLLQFRPDADSKGKSFGKGKVGKLVWMIEEHGLDVVADAFRTVAGNAKPGDAPRKAKGKAGKEVSNPPARKAEAPSGKAEATAPARKAESRPAVSTEIDALKATMAELSALMANLAERIASLETPAPDDDPAPTGGDSGPKGKGKPETPRKGGKGSKAPAFTVSNTMEVRGRMYGYCSDCVTRMLIQPNGRAEYWKVQAGSNPVSLAPAREADPARPASRSRHLKLTSKQMFARPSAFRKPRIVQPPASLTRLVAGR